MRAWTQATVLGPTKGRASLSVALMAVDKCLYGQRRDRVDLVQGHGLALGQDIEKVSKHDVEVDKRVCIWDDG